MFVSFRNLKANPGKIQDAIGIASYVCQAANAKGAELSVSVQIGGESDALSVTGRWDTLGDYERVRADLATDPEIAAAVRLGATLTTNAGESIGQIMRPPGERKQYTAFNSAEVQLAEVTDVVPFVLEIAESASEITGNEVGVARPFTGQMNQVLWFSFHDSLDALAQAQAKLDASEDFVTYYKRAEGLLVPNSLVAGIRQNL